MVAAGSTGVTSWRWESGSVGTGVPSRSMPACWCPGIRCARRRWARSREPRARGRGSTRRAAGLPRCHASPLDRGPLRVDAWLPVQPGQGAGQVLQRDVRQRLGQPGSGEVRQCQGRVPVGGQRLGGAGTMDHQVESRSERVRDHLRRPDAGGGEPLTERPLTPFVGHSHRVSASLRLGRGGSASGRRGSGDRPWHGGGQRVRIPSERRVSAHQRQLDWAEWANAHSGDPCQPDPPPDDISCMQTPDGTQRWINVGRSVHGDPRTAGAAGDRAGAGRPHGHLAARLLPGNHRPGRHAGRDLLTSPLTRPRSPAARRSVRSLRSPPGRRNRSPTRAWW